MMRKVASSLMATTLAVVAMLWLGTICTYAAATILPAGETCFSANSPTSGGLAGPIATLGTLSGGAGYTNGLYSNVPLTGGSGFGATANITVAGNVVANVSIVNPGTHYAGGDTLSAATANLGGAGSSFSVSVFTVFSTGTGMLGLLGTITGGSGGVAGTYPGVALTGGSGAGATATITVAGGAVTAVAILNPGTAYQVADTLSAASGNIGGVTGFFVPVSSVAINQSLAGGQVFMYVPNTTTTKQTWKNSTQTILNTNPITLDQNGCAIIYGTGSYRQILQDALGDTVWDQITTDTSAQQNVFWAGLAGGTPNAIQLTDPGFNATDGTVINFTALSNNTSATTITPLPFGTSIAVVKDTSAGPQSLTGGEIIANNPISVIYRTVDNQFHILNQIITLNANQCLLLTSFGGAGNNTTDNTTAFNSALAALTGSGGCIYFQPGKYKFNSAPTFNMPSGIFSVALVGSGQDNTILTWPNSLGGMTFNFSSLNNSIHVRDLSITTSVASGGNGITLNLNGGVPGAAGFAQNDFYRVTVRGDDGYAASAYWTNGINIQSVSNIQWDGVTIYGSSSSQGTGINFIGFPTASQYGIQYNVAKSTLQNLRNGIIYGSFIQGITVDQTNFTNDFDGIFVPASQTGTLAQLSVTNSQFNPVSASGTAIGTATPVVNVNIANNLIIVSQANAVGINLQANQEFTIVGNSITANNNSGTVGISVGPPQSAAGEGTISGNNIFGFNFNIALQSGAAGNNIVGNTLSAGGGTTAISNASSGFNQALNNIGFNPRAAGVITVGPSPFTYTAGISNETIYVTSGMVTSINFNTGGGVACTTTPCTVELDPNASMVVTYPAGAPTMNKQPH